MNSYEIGRPLLQIIQYLAELVRFCFSFLSSITISGIPLLSIFIATTILGAVFSILFNTVRGSGYYIAQKDLSDRYKKHKSSKREPKKGN